MFHAPYSGAVRVLAAINFGVTIPKVMPNPVCAISTRLRSLYRAAPLSLVLLLAAAGASRADDASPWDADQRSALRLIAGSTGNGAPTLRAGIAMRIAPGWKTYWRYAGDSGLPPTSISPVLKM